MKLIPHEITRRFGRQILLAQKHAPRAMFVAGVGGVVVSTVLACKATLKVEEVLDTLEEDISGVKTDLADTPGYRKDLAYTYARGAYSVGKLYAPAVVVGAISIAALTGSHVVLTRRNASLTAAYAAVSKGFEEYRERVKTELGVDKELDIYRGVTIVDGVDEDGKKMAVLTVDPNKLSMYAKFFDETNPNWVKNPELNRLFIQCQQNYMNNLLQSRGHVFLNEVYDALGMERSQAGQVVGWVISSTGDNYIDFGIFDANKSDFVNGWERSIILDFNVDGVIYDKI